MCEDTPAGIKCSCFDGFRAEGSSCIGNLHTHTHTHVRRHTHARHPRATPVALIQNQYIAYVSRFRVCSSFFVSFRGRNSTPDISLLSHILAEIRAPTYLAATALAAAIDLSCLLFSTFPPPTRAPMLLSVVHEIMRFDRENNARRSQARGICVERGYRINFCAVRNFGAPECALITTASSVSARIGLFKSLLLLSIYGTKCLIIQSVSQKSQFTSEPVPHVAAARSNWII